ncbi:SDR family NAD(P)-dependent oxidoreductase [Cupriavidus pinatubonensis]|uniref:Oxidoreductase n=1 Tax=Cupriavidus pinatubonensis TaxID=248026 RepID=A0ABM8X563_9BURK|nr:SDR family NAD(P)-dependent oxidoreductase [Cupriavidus pinatubonensis]CAG9175082.1 putative oxidoreductase [Cupriavidus pinatubonensis]
MSQIDPNMLKDKVAVITGAGRGIGRAIAMAYASAGAAVVCSARGEADIAQTAAMIREAGGRSIAQTADVADYESVKTLFQRASDTFGGVDIVVANAGVALEQRRIADGDPALWRKTIDINLTGAYHTAHAAIAHLRRRGAGKIIMIGSGQRKRPAPGFSAYSCSKSGLWMLTQSLATELQEDHISVNELIPGPVRTDMTRDVPVPPGEWFKDPADVVPLALFLAGMPDVGPSAQSYSLMRRA